MQRSLSRSIWDSVGEGTVIQRSRSIWDSVGQGTVIQKVKVSMG